MTVEREAVKRKKSTDPRTDPCGTLNEMGAGSEVWQWILTDCVRFVRYDENHSKAVPCIPKSRRSRWSNMYCLLYRRLLSSPKEGAEKHVHHKRRGESH